VSSLANPSTLMPNARYYGLFRTDKNIKEGLLLEEANCRTLQLYMDKHVNVTATLQKE
jgi:hypothetical protein